MDPREKAPGHSHNHVHIQALFFLEVGVYIPTYLYPSSHETSYEPSSPPSCPVLLCHPLFFQTHFKPTKETSSPFVAHLTSFSFLFLLLLLVVALASCGFGFGYEIYRLPATGISPIRYLIQRKLKMKNEKKVGYRTEPRPACLPSLILPPPLSLFFFNIHFDFDCMIYDGFLQ